MFYIILQLLLELLECLILNWFSYEYR